jgi:agmatinase
VSERTSDRAFTARNPYGTTSEPTYAGALSFVRRHYSRDLEGVDVVVSGVPCDLGTSNRPGARFGPRGIRAASAQLAWGAPWPWGFDPFERLRVIDWGDVLFDEGYVDRMLKAVEDHASNVLARGASLLTFGGDHLVTLPLLRAHARQFGPLALVHFDAHSDTWRDETLNHGSMFFHALREGLLVPEHSVQIGIRTHNDETHGLRVLDAVWVRRHGPEVTARQICETVGGRKAYLTFDVDCLDPSVAPGTGTPVVGGLGTLEAREILWGLGGVDLVAMDVVEVAPHYDVAEVTSLAAATLALDYLALRARPLPPARPLGDPLENLP